MDIASLWTLQCMMFFMVIAGMVLRKLNICPPESKGFLTDIVLDFILPCSIINSFRSKFDIQVFRNFLIILAVSIGMQAVSFILSRILYNKKPREMKKVLQYCTIVSNSGFLGLPIAASVLGAEGMMYASIYIIPMRIMMWTSGVACFTEAPDIKSVIKKLLLHPCIVALYIGIPLLIFNEPLGLVYQNILSEAPAVFSIMIKVIVEAVNKMLSQAGGCTTCLTMILIGNMVAEIKPRDFLFPDAFFLTGVRQILLPFIVFIICRIFSVPYLLTFVAVLMTGMPAGSTSAILAAKYNCDYTFATRCVVISTLLSMLTIPVWCMIMG